VNYDRCRPKWTAVRGYGGYGRLIAQHIDSLEETPRPHGSKKLKGDAGFSLRVGTYRVLYDIDDKAKAVTIIELNIAARQSLARQWGKSSSTV